MPKAPNMMTRLVITPKGTSGIAARAH